MSCLPTTDFASPKIAAYTEADLAGMDAFLGKVLQAEEIDISEWDTRNYRSVKDLRAELTLGYSEFKLVRECNVVRLRVLYDHPERGVLELFEERQDIFTRRMSDEERRNPDNCEVARRRCRASGFAVWEKRKPEEDVLAAKERALKEELYLSGPFSFEGDRYLEEWEDPEDYPLIDTLLLIYEDTAWLTKKQFEGVKNECQSEKRTIFKWYPRGTDPADIRAAFAAGPYGAAAAQAASVEAIAAGGPLDIGLGLGATRDLFQRMRVQQLGGRLVGQAIPVDTEWGRKRAKTARHLLEELDLRESRLPLMRYVNVVRVEVLADRGHGLERLQEVDRRFLDADGRTQLRGGTRPDSPFGVWLRFPFGADPLEHARRAVSTKLGIEPPSDFEDLGAINELEGAVDYANLGSRLHGRSYRVKLVGSQARDDYVFNDGKLQLRFGWRPF